MRVGDAFKMMGGGCPGAWVITPALLEGKFHVLVSQENRYAIWMLVFQRLLVWPVGNPQHPHLVILELHLVVLWICLHSVLCHCHIRGKDQRKGGQQNTHHEIG